MTEVLGGYVETFVQSAHKKLFSASLRCIKFEASFLFSQARQHVELNFHPRK